jgi:hypothetical protein
MFHIFVLLTTLIVSPVGPAGTQFGALQYQAKAFPTAESCQQFLDSPVFAADKESGHAYVENQLKEEFKGQLKYDYICSDKALQEFTPKE